MNGKPACARRPRPVRAFKAALDGEPAEVARWSAFSEEPTRGRARAWLVAEGYTPSQRSL